MKKQEVLNIIDEVMNNREIDSIRNAILAIRDKVIELDDEDWTSEYVATLKLRGDNEPYITFPYFKGAKYIHIDMLEKIDTGEYGSISYMENKEDW